MRATLIEETNPRPSAALSDCARVPPRCDVPASAFAIRYSSFAIPGIIPHS